MAAYWNNLHKYCTNINISQQNQYISNIISNEYEYDFCLECDLNNKSGPSCICCLLIWLIVPSDVPSDKMRSCWWILPSVSYDGFHPLLTVSRTKFCRKCRESNSIPLPLCNVTIERRNCEIYLKMSFTAESGVKLRVERLELLTINRQSCTITEKAPTSAFIFKTLLRHYAKQVLTPRPLNVKLGP